MAINLQTLKPAALMRLLNTAGLGTVINESRLRRHRNQAGYTIGSDKTVNLFKYAAWLTLEFFKEKPQGMSYADKKRLQALKSAEAVRAAQNIGAIPPISDPQRKDSALGSFRTFCETYFDEVFYLPWSEDHLRVVEKIEKAVLHGGLFALAMPRGSGKALALDTPIPTPTGWSTMGDLKVGDDVFDENGLPCRVIFATEIQYNRKCFAVNFSDGEQIICDAEHLWTVNDKYSRRNPLTITTEDMASRVVLPSNSGRTEYRYRIPLVQVPQLPDAQLSIEQKHIMPLPKICKERQIVSITPVPSVPVRCIQVDSPNKLYLAGKKMVPTHNTVLCQTAVVWAALNGAAPFVCLIAASAERAQNLLENIKTWLETNVLLQADFPEVCYPIKCLERIANRQKGQKYFGEPTRIEWSADKVVLPTIAGSNASGVVITSSGMRGSDIRGQQHARPDGRVERPSLVLIDDPQTTESAWSRSQSERREAILGGDVLGMAGPGRKIAGLMACTVIRPGDMASQILDREKHPDWQGERTKMVYSFPANDALWAKYAEIRAESLRNDGDGSAATKFYRENQAAMDVGSRVAWPQRFNPDEISAIQHAMNLKFRDESAFMSEYQNEPIIDDVGEEMLTTEQIAEKTNGYRPGVIPVGCNHLSMFIDVHQNALFWMLTAWEQNFTGYVVEYGTWPEQGRDYFTLRDMHKTLMLTTGGAGVEASIYAGLEQLCSERLSKVYYVDDGSEMRIGRCLIDANWGQTCDVIYQFCRQSIHSSILTPSHGQYLGASSLPFADHTKKRGDRVGLHWRIPGSTGTRAVRHIVIDTNYWKSFVHARLGVMMGDPGCLSLYGHDSKRHLLLSEHLTAEYRIKTTAQGRTVDEWKNRANHPDNHWFDCLVGCAVGASMLGAELVPLRAKQVPQRPRIRLSDRMKKNF